MKKIFLFLFVAFCFCPEIDASVTPLKIQGYENYFVYLDSENKHLAWYHPMSMRMKRKGEGYDLHQYYIPFHPEFRGPVAIYSFHLEAHPLPEDIKQKVRAQYPEITTFELMKVGDLTYVDNWLSPQNEKDIKVEILNRHILQEGVQLFDLEDGVFVQVTVWGEALWEWTDKLLSGVFNGGAIIYDFYSTWNIEGFKMTYSVSDVYKHLVERKGYNFILAQADFEEEFEYLRKQGFIQIELKGSYEALDRYYQQALQVLFFSSMLERRVEINPGVSGAEKTHSLSVKYYSLDAQFYYKRQQTFDLSYFKTAWAKQYVIVQMPHLSSSGLNADFVKDLEKRGRGD